MARKLVRFLLLWPFKLLDKVIELILHSNTSKRKQMRRWSNPMLIDEAVFLRRQLRDERYRHESQVKELKRDYRRREHDLKRRQRFQT